MIENRYGEFWEFVEMLDSNDLLQDVIIIGSWAEHIYQRANILSGFTASLRTLDIDILLRNKNHPRDVKNLPAIARAAGYTTQIDYLTGATKLFTKNNQLEVEFLIEQYGDGSESVIKTNLGVGAQALRHMGCLKANIIEAVIDKYCIRVPSPEAYVIHKAIINSQRGKKAEKDRESIFRLLPFLNANELARICNTLTKKERRAATEFGLCRAERHSIDEHER